PVAGEASLFPRFASPFCHGDKIADWSVGLLSSPLGAVTSHLLWVLFGVISGVFFSFFLVRQIIGSCVSLYFIWLCLSEKSLAVAVSLAVQSGILGGCVHDRAASLCLSTEFS